MGLHCKCSVGLIIIMPLGSCPVVTPVLPLVFFVFCGVSEVTHSLQVKIDLTVSVFLWHREMENQMVRLTGHLGGPFLWKVSVLDGKVCITPVPTLRVGDDFTVP